MKSPLKDLVEGNTRFASTSSKRRSELLVGQSPKAVVVACSDSRVSPEIIFDQGLGDLFVIRIAGNVLSSDAIASIEYAVDHLKTPLIIVLGHESCGAIAASASAKSAVSKNMNGLLSKIFKTTGHVPADKNMRSKAIENARNAANELIKMSSIISKNVRSEKTKVISAIYSLETGAVEMLESIS